MLPAKISNKLNDGHRELDPDQIGAAEISEDQSRSSSSTASISSLLRPTAATGQLSNHAKAETSGGGARAAR